MNIEEFKEKWDKAGKQISQMRMVRIKGGNIYANSMQIYTLTSTINKRGRTKQEEKIRITLQHIAAGNVVFTVADLDPDTILDVV